jgi:hypothetical protein
MPRIRYGRCPLQSTNVAQCGHDDQDSLVQITERLLLPQGGSEQDGDAMEPLRLVVGNKKGMNR